MVPTAKSTPSEALVAELLSAQRAFNDFWMPSFFELS
jgi:hypothetical protein